MDINGNRADFYWTLDESEGPLDLKVILDDIEINTNAEADSLALGLAEIEPGDHTIELVFSDRAGNINVLTYEFTIEEKKNTSTEEGGVSILWIILIILLIIIIVAVVIFLVIRKKPKEEEVDLKKLTGKVDKITIAPMPSPKHGHHRPSVAPVAHHHPPRKAAPTIHGGKVDGGYIRPERKSQKNKRTIKDIDFKPEPAPQRVISQKKESPKVKEEDTIEEWGEVEDWDEMEEMEEMDEFEEMEEV
jgi:hypothetical protein